MNEISIVSLCGELRADSRTFAPKLDVRHRQLMDNIRKYKSHFDELGLLPFQTEARPDNQHGGGDVVYALLNEDQAYFLLTLSRNTDAVVSAKLALVKAFRDAKSNSTKSGIARIEGKKARLEETGAIKMLVDYATEQGSKSAKMYYVSITKMTNQILGIESGQRDSLSHNVLDKIGMVEKMVDITLRDGMRAGLHYKQIYALAKEKVAHLIPLLPK